MEEQKPMIEEKKTSRMCKVLFSEKERLQFGEQVAAAYQHMRQAEEELDTVKKQYGGKIKGFETEIAAALGKLTAGWEMKLVDCLEIRNYENMTKKVVRQDSFELIEEVALSQEELQMAFPLPEPKAEPEEESEEKASPLAQAVEDRSIVQVPDEELPEDKSLFYAGEEQV